MATIEGQPKDAWDSPADGRTEVTFLLGRWRENGGAWQKTPVYVSLFVPDRRAAKRIFARFRFSNIVIRLGARRVGKSKRFVGKLPITEVDLKVGAPKRPKPIRDAALGLLRWDDGLGAYVVRRKIAGSSCEVSVDPAVAAKAGAIVGGCERDLERVLDAVTRKLLPLYDKTWRDGRAALSPAAFRAKVAKLSELELGKKGTTLRFHAGKLFGDHAIEVRRSATGKVTAIHLC